jgi:hypothetical protein
LAEDGSFDGGVSKFVSKAQLADGGRVSPLLGRPIHDHIRN